MRHASFLSCPTCAARHTFATWAIRDSVPTLTLAKLMGTSVQQLEDTYVRWLKGDAGNLRAVFDTADGRIATGMMRP